MFRLDEPKSRKPILVNLQVQGKQLSMELDIGAAVSIISLATKQQLFPAEPLLYTDIYQAGNIHRATDGSGREDESGGAIWREGE